MQLRYVGLALSVVVVVAVFFCLHLLSEVARLDNTRVRLGKLIYSDVVSFVLLCVSRI